MRLMKMMRMMMRCVLATVDVGVAVTVARLGVVTGSTLTSLNIVCSTITVPDVRVIL